MDSLEFLINITIIALLIPTIIYAYRLNKNLNVLRQNQNSLSKLVEALNDATFKAEHSIPKLKSITEHSSENLQEVVDNAKELKDDLLFINERADNLADRLEHVITDNRTTTKANSESNNNMNKSTETTNNYLASEDNRSEAEMELLKALRSIK